MNLAKNLFTLIHINEIENFLIYLEKFFKTKESKFLLEQIFM